VIPRSYRRIVPVPLHTRAKLLVGLSGAAEVAGGVGVLLPWPSSRRLFGCGLIALLAAVFPANLYMASAPERFARIPRWALYARLPLQPLMMWWAWTATRR
jgi:uncharacterized membrane protein